MPNSGQSGEIWLNALKDYDGNWYDAVIIGDQVWMAENLRTTHYSDGTALTYLYPNGSEDNFEQYGLLYDWSTIMNGASSSSTNPSGVQGIAPTGWHVPSNSELNQLATAVNSNSTLAGFFNNQLPGYYNSSYYNFNTIVYFNSSTEYSSVTYSYLYYAQLNSSTIASTYQKKSRSYSVRCLFTGNVSQFITYYESLDRSGLYEILEDVVEDNSGNLYDVILIDDIVMMTSNLKDTIGTKRSLTQFSDQPSYYSPNDNDALVPERGYLYNRAAVDSYSINKWVLPTYDDWLYILSRLMRVKSICSDTGWRTCDIPNSVGNHQELNNESGLNITPNGSIGNSDSRLFGAIALLAIELNEITAGPYSDTYPSKTMCISHSSTELINFNPYFEHDNDYSAVNIRYKFDGTINEFMGWYNTYKNAVQDYDGNWYDAVIIGDQVWMASNLRTTHDRNGNSISYSHLYNNSSYDSIYGLLYTWIATMNGETSSNTNPSGVQGIAPTGWHIPSKAEWEVLKNNTTVKDLCSTTEWDTSSVNNSPGFDQSMNGKSGFNILPAGGSSDGNSTLTLGQGGLFQTSYMINTTYQFISYIYAKYNLDHLETGSSGGNSAARSVRCVYTGSVSDFLTYYNSL